MLSADEKYMQRCIELAQLGAGNVSPNPMVGCVIVHQQKIIAESWHKQYGGPHAEVNAIAQLVDTSILTDSTLYVNLEPCSHYGKTPPCADLLIKHNVKKVVIGCHDPNPSVAGKGIEKLKTAGIEVEVGVLEEKCIDLNKRFFTFHKYKRPYIILKFAQSADGFLAPDARLLSPSEFEEKRHITGFIVQAMVHKWRGEEDAIMVGTKTILTDNPALNTRAYPGKNPTRIVIDRHNKLPRNSKVFDGLQPTFVFTENDVESNLNLQYLKIDFTQNVWEQILKNLYQLNILSVIVEGGAITLNHILETNLWDEAQVITSTKILKGGVKAPAIIGTPIAKTTIDQSNLTIYARNSLPHT